MGRFEIDDLFASAQRRFRESGGSAGVFAIACGQLYLPQLGYRIRVPCSAVKSGLAPGPPFVTVEGPFITANLDSSHSGWLARRSAANIARMLAEGLFAISLAVRIYDASEVPGHHLATARATVEGIMKKGAGVGVTWTPCPCTSPVRSDELVIRIAASSPASQPGSLGFSFVDLGRRAGTLATVFADRVKSMAAFAGVDQGELLGRVIAHEIAHLLIGTHDHSPRGLMRGAWRASELARQRPSDWLLSPSEGLRIRRAIWRRVSESAPAMMAADADATSNSTLQ